jgi:hypothetical protein
VTRPESTPDRNPHRPLVSLGLRGGYRDDEGQSLISTYRQSRHEAHVFRESHPTPDEAEHDWPEDLLPAWDWGCAVWSCIDARSPTGCIVTHDGALGETLTRFSLLDWLSEWAGGWNMWKELFEEEVRTMINPFTRKSISYRGQGRAIGTPWKR